MIIDGLVSTICMFNVVKYTAKKVLNFIVSVPWVPEVFSSLGVTELSDEAAKASHEAARKKPLAPTDNNLTSMPTPISFD